MKTDAEKNGWPFDGCYDQLGKTCPWDIRPKVCYDYAINMKNVLNFCDEWPSFIASIEL